MGFVTPLLPRCGLLGCLAMKRTNLARARGDPYFPQTPSRTFQLIIACLGTVNLRGTQPPTKVKAHEIRTRGNESWRRKF